MNYDEVWKSKEASGYLMKIIGPNIDGTIKVTFDFRFNPRRTHNYSKWYIERYYEYAGYNVAWSLGKGLRILTKPVGPKKIEPKIDPFEELDPEKVLFGNYTGKDKVNIWKEV